MEPGVKAGGGGTGRWTLVGLSLTMLMPSFPTSSANVVLPDLARTFAAPFQAAQWIVLGYLLTLTALTVVVGRLGDIVGRRRLLLAGVAVFAAGSLFSGIAPSLELLIAARVVQGCGAATMMALTIAFIGAVVAPARTGRAMGLLGTMSAAGTTLGPALGGVLTAWAGSRAIFLVNVPIAALALLIVSRTLPIDSPRKAAGSSRFDVAGMFLLAAALTGYALAMTMGHGHFGPLNAAILVAAFSASVAFVAVEARVADPLVPLELFRNQALVAGLSANLIVSMVMMATLIVGPFYLSKVVGLSPAATGLVLAAGPLVAALAGVPAGRLVDRFGPERAALGGLAALGAGAIVLAAATTSGVARYSVPIVTMTIGYGVFQAANSTKIMAGASAAERGLVSGLLNLSRNLGLVSGASAMGALFAWGTAAHEVLTASPKAIAAGMQITFAVAAILIAGSLLITLRVARRDLLRAAPQTLDKANCAIARPSTYRHAGREQLHIKALTEGAPCADGPPRERVLWRRLRVRFPSLVAWR